MVMKKKCVRLLIKSDVGLIFKFLALWSAGGDPHSFSNLDPQSFSKLDPDPYQ
jgi:hypothetical protein